MSKGWRHDAIMWEMGVAPLMAQIRGYAKTFERKGAKSGRRATKGVPADQWEDLL